MTTLAQLVRKNDSQRVPHGLRAIEDMTLSTRPECSFSWKLGGRRSA